MFSEDDLLPVSALQHLVFCERQWALIHLEKVWEENRLTAEGRVLHERSDAHLVEVRAGVIAARALPLRSMQHGLAGRADAVEFLPAASPDEPGEPIAAMPPGRWQPYPVEYKRGRPKQGRCDEVQLCAQALCLEEMLNAPVPAGALFYARTRRRVEVQFDPPLRSFTLQVIARLHELARDGRTPPARYEPRCDNCSLIGICLPKALGRRRKVGDYLDKAIRGRPETEDSP
jgi:CRISPR-associated exonuclease Cas4